MTCAEVEVHPSGDFVYVSNRGHNSIAVMSILRMRVPTGVSGHGLGWMSEQWLAEQRASHSP